MVRSCKGCDLRGRAALTTPPTQSSPIHVFVGISSGVRGYGMRFSGGVLCVRGEAKKWQTGDQLKTKNQKYSRARNRLGNN